jgi:hypothetical protein
MRESHDTCRKHQVGFSRSMTWSAVVAGLLGLCIAVLSSHASARTQIEAAQSASQPPICASIRSKHYERQQNLRASEVLVKCGLEKGGTPWGSGSLARGQYGLAATSSSVEWYEPDHKIIFGSFIFPHVTQAESFTWSNGHGTIVVAYNDTKGATENPPNFSGVSVSRDWGTSFSRVEPHSPFVGHGANWGDPIVVWNQKLGSGLPAT